MLQAFQFDKVNICWASQNTSKPNNNVHTYRIYSAWIVDVHTSWSGEREMEEEREELKPKFKSISISSKESARLSAAAASRKLVFYVATT